MPTNEIVPGIRAVLKRHGQLGVDADRLAPTDDLYAAGMTSHANVKVMMALEDAFGVEFPDHLLNRNTFQSIDSIREAVSTLTGTA